MKKLQFREKKKILTKSYCINHSNAPSLLMKFDNKNLLVQWHLEYVY